jgi:hypothetical protein
MKKISILFAALTLAGFAIAQKSDGAKTVIKLNPLGAIFGNASLGFEFKTSAKNSINILPTFGSTKVDDVKYSNFGLGVEYRIYSQGEAPKGFYFAPGLRFFNW